MSQITLKRCGVRFDPPAVVITYFTKSKMHRRTMPLRNFSKRSGVSRVAEDLKGNSRHKKYLEQLPLTQLEKLITLIHDKLNGMSLDASLSKNKGLDSIDPEEDLNKVDEATLKRKKNIMASSFDKNKKEIGDPDFQYDVEVDFQGGGGAIESCDWDSDQSDNEF